MSPANTTNDCYDVSRGELGILYDMIADLTHKLDTHISDSTEYREAIAAKIVGDEKLIEMFKDAFPDGNPHLHRSYHEALMEDLKERAELRKMLKKEVAKWGLLGILGFLAIAAWNAFLLGPQGK